MFTICLQLLQALLVSKIQTKVNSTRRLWVYIEMCCPILKQCRPDAVTVLTSLDTLYVGSTSKFSQMANETAFENKALRQKVDKAVFFTIFSNTFLK